MGSQVRSEDRGSMLPGGRLPPRSYSTSEGHPKALWEGNLTFEVWAGYLRATPDLWECMAWFSISLFIIYLNQMKWPPLDHWALVGHVDNV